MKKNLKITNRKQREKLVDFMKRNPDLGRGKMPSGLNKALLKEKWNSFTVELNALGPPTRTAKEWQRVWTHHKANLKRKLTSKRYFHSIGSGPSTAVRLDPLEQSTIDLMSMNTEVNLKGFEMDLPLQVDSDSESINLKEIPTTSNSEQQSQIKNKPEDVRLKILKEQAKNQEEILDTLKRLEKTLHKNYEINKNMYELKKTKADLQNELIRAKLKLTLKRLEEIRN